MFTTMTSKGQVTLPVEARRRLGLGPGTRFEVLITDDERLEMVVVRGSVTDLKGVLGEPRKRLSLEEIDAAVARGASE